MPAKKGKKRGGRKNAVDQQLVDAKLQKLDDLMTVLDSTLAAYEEHANETCEKKAREIDNMYKQKLYALAEHIRNMTLTEVIEHEAKHQERPTVCTENSAVRSQFERNKAFSEKKKTFKKDRKRSVSAQSSSKQLNGSRLLLPPKRAISNDSLYCTPSKFGRISPSVVTPKFDITKPMLRMGRKPKPGETLMSVNGSPIQNYTNNNKTTLSLPSGNVIELDGVPEQELAKTMNDPIIRRQLSEAKKKLNNILQS